MKNFSMILIEKLQKYQSYHQAKLTSVLSSGKIDKYKYLTGEETLPSNQKK